MMKTQTQGPRCCSTGAPCDGEVTLIPEPREMAAAGSADKFDDEHYPASTMGRAADILDVQPGFLRSLDATGLLRPYRSAGGHRRYSRTDLALAARVRELLDENMPLAAAFRIVTLEHQLEIAQRRIAELEAGGDQPGP